VATNDLDAVLGQFCDRFLVVKVFGTLVAQAYCLAPRDCGVTDVNRIGGGTETECVLSLAAPRCRDEQRFARNASPVGALSTDQSRFDECYPPSGGSHSRSRSLARGSSTQNDQVKGVLCSVHDVIVAGLEVPGTVRFPPSHGG
jgi:hypothetical protein